MAETTDPTTPADFQEKMASQTCRYLRRNGQQCTAEAVDTAGEILLCTKHLSRAITLLRAMRQAVIDRPEAEDDSAAEVAGAARELRKSLATNRPNLPHGL